jgi:hypothetical protein
MKQLSKATPHGRTSLQMKAEMFTHFKKENEERSYGAVKRTHIWLDDNDYSCDIRTVRHWCKKWLEDGMRFTPDDEKRREDSSKCSN